MLGHKPELGRQLQQPEADPQQHRNAKSSSSKPKQKPNSSSRTTRYKNLSSSVVKSNKTSTRVGSSNDHRSRGQTGNSKQSTECRTFKLHSPNDQSIKQIIDFLGNRSLNRFKTCVVTIISKEPLNGSMRQHLVETLMPAADREGDPASEVAAGDLGNSESCDGQEEMDRRELVHYENQVHGHVNFDDGLVVMTLDSFLNTSKLVDLSESLLVGDLRKRPIDRFADAQLLMDSWSKWNQNLIKTLLILFTMSHIVVIYQPEPSIDYNLIHVLKLLEVLRCKSQNRICDLLETIASAQMFPQQWIRNCRIACPRALFICDTNYLDIDLGSDRNLAKVKEDLEDQIYLLLKKSNILAKSYQNSQQSLFSIPDQEDFVFILDQVEPKPFHGTKGDILMDETPKDMITKIYNLSLNRSTYGNTHESDFLFGSQTSLDDKELAESEVAVEPTQEDINLLKQRKIKRRNQIRHFLHKHILSIQTAALQETGHESKHSSKQSSDCILLPRFDDFFNVLMRLKCLMFPSQSFDDDASSSGMSQLDSMSIWPAHDERRFVDIHDLLNTDDLFSQRLCHRARLSAFELYTRGLQMPPQDEIINRKSLESALEFYNNHARGSSRQVNLQLLKGQCERYWKETRLIKSNSHDHLTSAKNRATRALSSDAAPTTNQRSPGKTNDSLSVIRRSNGVLVTSNCDCGRTSSLLIKPSDRRKKLERVDVQRIND